MHIDILTIFPHMFDGPFAESIIKRAQDQGKVTLSVHDLRQWSVNKHHTVDDRPFGGGPGMVMMVEPIDKALIDLTSKIKNQKSKKIILTSARGPQFTQQKAQDLSKVDHLIFIAGHYEGVDQRVSDHLIDEELSIGPYVLTGGELPAMVMIDAIVRLIPGVLGNPDSLLEESHSPTAENTQPTTNLEYPHYTRPETYKGWRVPEVLLSGNHAQIQKWRQNQSARTDKKK
jgi:tRNA (guanine37-N1)-methyltransferase